MAVAGANQNGALLQGAKLPWRLRFPLFVILSLSLSSLLYSFIDRYTSRELSAVIRIPNAWWKAGALLVWRAIELSLGWFGNYDSLDIGALTLLSHGPLFYFLYAFYPSIGRSTILSSLIVDVLATSLPMGLLRPLSKAHTPWKSTDIPNQDIITNLSIQILATLLGATIYSTILGIANASFLPVALVTYFEIPSIVAAHNISPITFLPVMTAFGLAAYIFIFNPVVTGIDPSEDFTLSRTKSALAEKIRNNAWNHMPGMRAAIIRTLTLTAFSGINTFVQMSITIDGSEATGAAVYAIVWALAAIVTGASLGCVGAV